MADNTAKGKQDGSPKNLYLYGGVLLAGIAVFVGAVFLGKSDEGVINVSEAIRSSNVAAQQSANENGADTAPAVTEIYSTEPNGGLVGKGDVTPRPKPAVRSASTTASSTDSTATSTDPEAKEGAEAPEGDEPTAAEAE